jgi:hypothetical protein
MKTTWLVAVIATGAMSGSSPSTPVTADPVGPSQSAPQASLPYAAVHEPQFVSVAEAPFMKDDDRVIGLMSGSVAKAYSAGILSQHGLVEDQSPKGPIAITW